MMITGVDYHPNFQTIVYFVEETGEYDEQELNHSDGQAEEFYRDLKRNPRACRSGGYRIFPLVRAAVYYDNCSGTAIGWCRCARGS
jgi:hypothetical protein